MKNTKKNQILEPQELNLNKNDMLRVYDYAMEILTNYFEKNINPRLKNSSFDCELAQDKKCQKEILAYFEDFREVINYLKK